MSPATSEMIVFLPAFSMAVRIRVRASGDASGRSPCEHAAMPTASMLIRTAGFSFFISSFCNLSIGATGQMTAPGSHSAMLGPSCLKFNIIIYLGTGRSAWDPLVVTGTCLLSS